PVVYPWLPSVVMECPRTTSRMQSPLAESTQFTRAGLARVAPPVSRTAISAMVSPFCSRVLPVSFRPFRFAGRPHWTAARRPSGPPMAQFGTVDPPRYTPGKTVIRDTPWPDGIFTAFRRGCRGFRAVPRRPAAERRRRLPGGPLELGREIDEPGVVQLVGHGHGTNGTTTVLGEDDVRLARALMVRLLGVGAVQQHDHVSVLLQRTGLAEVG